MSMGGPAVSVGAGGSVVDGVGVAGPRLGLGLGAGLPRATVRPRERVR